MLGKGRRRDEQVVIEAERPVDEIEGEGRDEEDVVDAAVALCKTGLEKGEEHSLTHSTQDGHCSGHKNCQRREDGLSYIVEKKERGSDGQRTMRVVRRLDGPGGEMFRTSSEDVGVKVVIVGGSGVLEDEDFLHYSWVWCCEVEAASKRRGQR